MADTNLIARIILRLQDEASRGLNAARQQVSGIGQEVDRVKQLMIGLFSFVAIKEGLEKLVGLSDKFANLSARIKLATSSEQEYNTAQGELFNIAQRSRTALDTVVALYAKVQIGVKNLGGTQKQSFDVTEAVTRAFKISGATAAESAGGIQQFTQSIASGVFRGEEFNSVMENGTRLAQALADGLGVPIFALRKMAEAGELTSDRVIAALLSQKDKLAAEYALLPQTVAGAWQQLENQFLLYIGKSKNVKEATQNIADGIGYVTGHLNTFIDTAITSGQVIIGLFAARKFAGLADFAQGLMLARAEVRATEVAALTAAANAQRAAAAIATSVEVGAAAATAAIARGATEAEAAVAAAAAAGTAAARAAIIAGSTVAEASAIAGAAAGRAALAAGVTIEGVAVAAGAAAARAATASGAAATQASAMAGQASAAARAEAVLATGAAAVATDATRAAATAAASARVSDALAAQRSIALAREEAIAKLSVANATARTAEAAVAALAATVQSSSIVHLLTVENERLTIAQRQRSAAQSDLIALSQREALVNAELAASREALVLSMQAQHGAARRLAEEAALATGAMGRLANAGKAAMAFVGGPLGVAVIAAYALYTALEKLTGSEEKAALKSKALADALALSNAEVRKLSAVEVDIDFVKTEHTIDVIKDKIKTLESFSFGKLFDVGDLAAQRANLLQTLDVLQKRKDALVAQKNDTIINFDASTLSAEELNAELVNTKAKIDEIHQRIDPLKKQLDEGLIGSEAVNADLALLNAYEIKFGKLAEKSGDSAFEVYQLRQSLSTIPEAADALAKGIDNALASAKKAAIQHASELIETAKDSAGKTSKPYDETAKAITKSFEDSTQAIDTELKNQLDAIKLNAANEEVEIDATAQAFRDAETEKTTAAEDTKTQLERVWNETYGTATELTRQAGGDVERLEKEGADARIGILQTVVDAYQASISTMIDEEHRLLGEIKKTDEYRLNIQNSIEDKIRESNRKTLSDEAAYADEHNQIYEKLAQADELRRHGQLDAAQKTAEEALRLADSHDRVLKDASDNAVKRAMEAEAKAKASADKVAEYSFAGGDADEKRMAAQAKRIDAAADKVAEAHEKVIEAQQKQAEEQAANERRNKETTTAYQKILESLDATAARLREKQQGALGGILGDLDGSNKKLSSLKDQIQGIQDLANKKSDIKLKLGADEALKDVDKLKTLLAAKELTVKIKADPANADKEVAELNKRLKDAHIAVPAAIAFEQIRNEQLDKVTQPLTKALSEQHAVKINADDAVNKAAAVDSAVTAATQPRKLTILTAEAEADMNRMLADIAKVKDPQQINVDVSESEGKVAMLNNQLAAIPKNTITRLDADGNPISTTIIKTKAELEGLRSVASTPIAIDMDAQKARDKTAQMEYDFREKSKGMVEALSKEFDLIKAVSPDIDTEKAKGQIEEFVGKADDLLKAVELGLNTTTASTELDRLKAEIDAKLSAQTEAVHKVNPDFAAAFNAISELKQPTSSTHTVYINKVENNATGGLIQHLAAGGRVAARTFRRVIGAISGPGTGTSDEVPVMASNGEFMVKTAAVNYYGTAFMNAINNLQFPLLKNYATGGAITPAAEAHGSAEPRRDIVELNFNFANKTITLQSPRSVARELAVELRSLARVG